MNEDGVETARNLSLKPAAQRVGVSPHTLRTWAVYQHRLPFYRVGRRVLFATSDLDAFVARHRVAARAEKAPAVTGGGGVPRDPTAAGGAPADGHRGKGK